MDWWADAKPRKMCSCGERPVYPGAALCEVCRDMALRPAKRRPRMVDEEPKKRQKWDDQEPEP